MDLLFSKNKYNLPALIIITDGVLSSDQQTEISNNLKAMKTKYIITYNQRILIIFCDTENKYYPRLMEYMGLSFERDVVKLELYEKFWNYFIGHPNNKVIVALHESQ